MIFNTQIQGSGGGSSVSGWTDVSSAFTDNTDASSIKALTDGTLVYLTANEWTYISVPSVYEPSASAVGIGIGDGFDLCALACDQGMSSINIIDPQGGSSVIFRTIVYPIA